MQPSIIPTLTQINKPGSGSSSFSFRRGKAGRSDSGYFRNTLYMISTAFFRMYGLVCDIYGNRRPLGSLQHCTPCTYPTHLHAHFPYHLLVSYHPTPALLTCCAHLRAHVPTLPYSTPAPARVSPPLPRGKPSFQLPAYEPYLHACSTARPSQVITQQCLGQG